MTDRLRLPWRLCSCSLLLLVAVAAEMKFAPGDPLPATPVPASPQAATDASLPTFTAPPDSHFTEIGTRPLFVPGRRPERDDGPADRPRGAPAAILVQGVVLSPDRRIAVIRHGNPPRFESLARGAEIDGWRVERIENDRVTLSANGRTLDLPVGERDRPGEPASAASAAAAARTAADRAPRLSEPQK
ncbi:MAG: hypothetical protein ACREFQ_15480 [Stellaceae bacterium]